MYDDAIKKKAAELHAENLSLREIGRRLNVSYGVVRLWVDADAARRDRQRSRRRAEAAKAGAAKETENARRRQRYRTDSEFRQREVERAAANRARNTLVGDVSEVQVAIEKEE